MGKRVTDIADGEPFFDLADLDRPFRPPSALLLLALLVFATVTCAMQYVYFGDEYSEKALATYCWLYAAVGLLLLVFKLARPGPRNWLSPDILFWLLYTIFHVPFVVFYLLGWVDWTARVFHSASGMNRGMCVVVMCLIGFMVGYELGPIGRSRAPGIQPARRISNTVMFAARMFLFVSLVVAALALILGVGSLILTQGYEVMRRRERFGISTEQDRWMAIAHGVQSWAIIIYVAACTMRYRRPFHGVLLPGLLGAMSLFYILSGGRSEAAVAIMPFLFAFHYFVRRIPAWLGILMFMGAVALFGLIGVGRKAQSLSPSAMIRAYREYRQDEGVGPLVAALAQSGGSFKTVDVACTYIPSHEGYWRGDSLLSSTLMVIPNPVVAFRQQITPSAWATFRATGEVGGERAGWGSSIAMESYMNFGIVGGAAFMAVVGYMMRRIYDTVLRRPTFLRVCLLMICLSGLSMWVRNYSHHFFRPVAWTMMVAWVFWTLSGGPASVRTAVQNHRAIGPAANR